MQRANPPRFNSVSKAIDDGEAHKVEVEKEQYLVDIKIIVVL